MPKPLLTIGIPTYNRLGSLQRAVDSALAQDCGNLEILIGDNASSDGTEDYCRALSQQNPEVRYLRHPANRGPTANFNTVLREARGEYFLFLSDDDWLQPSYGSCCITWLRAHPGFAMAGGSARYVREDGASTPGRPIDLRQASPAQRVLAYLRAVDDGGGIYGVLPRPVVDSVSEIRNVTGNDWLFVAEIAALGRVASLPEVTLYRALAGTSASFGSLVRTLELPTVQGRFPFTTIACAFAADVLWRSPVHRAAIVPAARVALAVLCAGTMARRGLWLGILSLGQRPVSRRPYLAAKALYTRIDGLTGGQLVLRFPGHSTRIAEHPEKPGRAVDDQARQADIP